MEGRSYTLEFPEVLKRIYSTFHVSNLKKSLAEGDIVVPMDEIQLDDKLHMIEEPVEVVDREVTKAEGTMAWRCRACDGFYGKILLCSGLSRTIIMPPKSCTIDSSCYSLNDQEKCNAVLLLSGQGKAIRNVASGFRPQGKKVKFASTTLEGPTLTWWKTKVVTMGLEIVNQMPWTELKQLMTAEFCPLEERFNELALMCPKMVEPESVKVDAYIRRLADNIKGEVTSSKPADLNEASSQRQGNARAIVTDPTDGKLPLCEHFFTRHVGQCTVKCHKYGKVGHKVRYCKEKSVATGANAQPIWTCYDCGEQGYTRN
ncbi:hypothetical protein Tco_0195682 [Tanacetum coccineum]